MKYADLVSKSYGDHIGSITVMGQDLQLCDHMQDIDHHYYATTFILSVNDRQALKVAGAHFGSLGDETNAVYLTQELMSHAKPLHDHDDMTKAMIDRMIKGLAQVNGKQGLKHA